MIKYQKGLEVITLIKFRTGILLKKTLIKLNKNTADPVLKAPGTTWVS
jgi:hypothetical protein